jgi:hypothetical protein
MPAQELASIGVNVLTKSALTDAGAIMVAREEMVALTGWRPIALRQLLLPYSTSHEELKTKGPMPMSNWHGQRLLAPILKV